MSISTGKSPSNILAPKESGIELSSGAIQECLSSEFGGNLEFVETDLARDLSASFDFSSSVSTPGKSLIDIVVFSDLNDISKFKWGSLDRSDFVIFLPLDDVWELSLFKGFIDKLNNDLDSEFTVAVGQNGENEFDRTRSLNMQSFPDPNHRLDFFQLSTLSDLGIEHCLKKNKYIFFGYQDVKHIVESYPKISSDFKTIIVTSSVNKLFLPKN